MTRSPDRPPASGSLRVALTQSNGRLEGLAASLERRGYDVVRNPLIETVPRTDPDTRAKAEQLLGLPWVLFTSRSGVEAWQALELPFSGPRFGAVGEKTARSLVRAGGQVSLVAGTATAEGLADAFVSRRDAAGPVGLPQGNRARPTLRAALRRAGFAVQAVTVYDTQPCDWNVDEAVDAVVLASPSAVQALPEDVAAHARLITLGPTTSRAVRDRRFQPHEATSPSVEAILDTLDRDKPAER